MSEFVALDPAQLSLGTRYDLLARVVVPRPIALVSTLSIDGIPNLAPFSYFTVGGANPPSLVFCPVRASGGRKKDTLANIEATSEYVINLVDRPMTMAMNEASASLPPGVSEWDRTGFTPLPSEKVGPARVATSPVSFEMKLFQTVHHGQDDGGATYVIGEIVWVHMLAEVWNDGDIQPLLPIARLGGPSYLDLEQVELFDLSRPGG